MESHLFASLRGFLEWQLRGPLAGFAEVDLIDLRVTAFDPLADPMADSQAFATDSSLLEQGRFTPRALALLQNSDRRLVLTGISGAGKTVALGRLAHLLATAAVAGLGAGNVPGNVPLWAPAAELPEIEIGSVVSWLAGRLEDGGIYSGSEDLARSLLLSGQLVLLVDSIHEVTVISPGRTRSLARLAALPNVRMVATTRPGYELPGMAGRCEFLSLEGLNPPEREKILNSQRLGAESLERLRRLALQPRLRRAVEVPQIWQMAIALVRGGVDISDVTQEAVLYELFFEQAWRAPRVGTTIRYTADDLEPLLEMLGGTSAFRGGQDVSFSEAISLIERWTGCRSLCLHLQYPREWPERLLDDLPRFFQPVLRVRGEERAIGFAHGSLGDFLAARWVLRVRRAIPAELLEIPQLADLISLATELQELRGMTGLLLAELDSEQVRSGSLDLLLSWIRRTPRERIEGTITALRDRFKRAARDETRQLIKALDRRGVAWASGLIPRLLTGLSSEEAAPLREAFESKRRRHRAAERPPEFSKGKAAKDLPELSEPLPPFEELLRQLHSSDAQIRASAARSMGLSGNVGAVTYLIPLLNPSTEESTEVRGRVATALGRLGAVEAVPWLIARLRSDQELVGMIRGRAARALGYLGDERAVGPLIDRLDPAQEPDPIVRGSAATALGSLGDTSAVESLIGRLDPAQEMDPKNRGSAATALGSLGDTRAVESLIGLLDPAQEPDPKVRGSAATALGSLGDTHAVESLIGLLDPAQEPDPKVRGSAATALGSLGDTRAVESLIGRLGPAQEPDPKVRGSAAKALGLLGDVRAVELLIGRLDPAQELDPKNRGAAATALGSLGDVRAVESLIGRLDPAQEPGPAVRGSAATALGTLGDVRAVKSLIGRLDPGQEPGPDVRGSAATALGILGDTAAVESLIGRLDPAQESGPNVRGSAATALGILGDTRAVESLIARLDPAREPRPDVRGSAATALGILGDVRAVEPLISRLDPAEEPGSDVRGSSATALGILGDVRAVEPLIGRLDPGEEPGPDVRGSAATALGILGDTRAVEPLIGHLDLAQEPDSKTRGAAATALGLLGDMCAVESLIGHLDPAQEPEAIVRGSTATALGILGDVRAVESLIGRLDSTQEPEPKVRGSAATALARIGDASLLSSIKERLTGVGAEPDSRVRGALYGAVKRLYRLQTPERFGTLNAKALDTHWRKLLEDFFLETEIPPATSFPRELERCLQVLERYLGGAASRGWTERDYERVLAALLAKGRAQVVTEAEPADRERTDILLDLGDGSRVVLELKFYEPRRVPDYAEQLRRYLTSLQSDHRPVTGHLILLDRSPVPAWRPQERYLEEDGVPSWRVHVNRQPASMARGLA